MHKHRVMGAVVCTGAVLGALALGTFHAHAASGRAVFVIALENHNWEQPVHKFDGGIQQIYQNPAAPYINSLVNGTAAISNQVSYASAYYHVLATPGSPAEAGRHVLPRTARRVPFRDVSE